MPALQRKQSVMSEVLLVKQALHKKGVSQAEEGDPAEKINSAFKEGFSLLEATVREKTSSEDRSQEPNCNIS